MITLNAEGLAELKKIFGNEDVCRICGGTNFHRDYHEDDMVIYCKNCGIDDRYDIAYPSYILHLHSIMDVMLFHDKSYSEAFEIEKKSYERSKYRGEK